MAVLGGKRSSGPRGSRMTPYFVSAHQTRVSETGQINFTGWQGRWARWLASCVQEGRRGDRRNAVCQTEIYFFLTRALHLTLTALRGIEDTLKQEKVVPVVFRYTHT